MHRSPNLAVGHLRKPPVDYQNATFWHVSKSRLLSLAACISIGAKCCHVLDLLVSIYLLTVDLPVLTQPSGEKKGGCPTHHAVGSNSVTCVFRENRRVLGTICYISFIQSTSIQIYLCLLCLLLEVLHKSRWSQFCCYTGYLNSKIPG